MGLEVVSLCEKMRIPLCNEGGTQGGARRAKEICLEFTTMSEQLIKIQLPDGSVREVPHGTTPP